MSLEKKFLKARKDFPMLTVKVHDKPLVYLDSAATSQKPNQVIDTITDFYKNHYGTVHRAVYSTAIVASEAYQATRKKVQVFLNAQSDDEIIFTKGTTEAINLVAYSFGKQFIEPGDEIIITEMEHHSNIVPWQIAAQDRKAILKVIPFTDDGVLDMDEFKKALSNKTKIVAVAHISNVLGTINPIKEIVKLAHEKGAKVLVDGAQSACHMPIDVQALDVDFFAFSGHKLIGPTGIGVLYGKKELLDAMPPYQGGGDMIQTVTFEKTTYNTLPLKFEAGTPLIAEVIGLGASIDYLTSLSLSDIYAYEKELLSILLYELQTIPGLYVLGLSEHKSAICTFSINGVHPLDIATLLDLHGIAIRSGHLCAQPTMRHFGITAAARASLSFYNTKEEIHFFIEHLKKVIKQLRGS